jgi:hypothetical protein
MSFLLLQYLLPHTSSRGEAAFPGVICSVAVVMALVLSPWPVCLGVIFSRAKATPLTA